MEIQKEPEGFRYIYSAKEQEEIKNIRKKYAPEEENKMEVLRRLDRSVTQKGTIQSLIVGILGVLILGSGMSCVLVGDSSLFLPGIVIGLVGILMVSCAYPIYQHTTAKERERIAPEIIRLTDELMK